MPLIAYENDPIELTAQDREHLLGILGGHFERRDGGWAVCRLAGHVGLPSGETLFIRSRKAPSAALCAWLAYVDPALQGVRFLGQDVDAEEEGELSAIVARSFVAELIDVLRIHGLNRRYRRLRVRTGTVRGAIDFPRLVRAGGELSRMPCVAWERLPQTPINRTLAAALRRVQTDAVLRRACHSQLPEAASALSDVEPLADRGLVEGRTLLGRNERHLERVLALARLLLRSTGFEEGQSAHGGAFLVNLEALFEKTVAKAFQDAQLSARAKVPLPFDIEHPNGTRSRGSMEMDVYVPATPSGSIVIDAKYKTSVASSNLQQMVTYCLMTGSKQAILILPEGFVPGGRRYRFVAPPSPDGNQSVIDVTTAELSTGGRSVEEWRDAARRLSNYVVGAFTGESETNVTVHALAKRHSATAEPGAV